MKSKIVYGRICPNITMHLVAIRGAHKFWGRFGFVCDSNVHLSDDIVKNYGGCSKNDDVLFMTNFAGYPREFH